MTQPTTPLHLSTSTSSGNDGDAVTGTELTTKVSPLMQSTSSPNIETPVSMESSTDTHQKKDSDSLGRPHLVLRIHGTFAYQESDSGQAWWQNGSPFCQTLAEMLGKSFVFNVDNKDLDLVFHWSGNNSETARRQAAVALLDRLQLLECNGDPYHVIAHSHGGSVLWEALSLATEKHQCTNQTDPLPFLKSFITVGTPFLHFIPRLSLFWCLIPLLLTVGIILWPCGRWFLDLWNAKADAHALPGWAALVAFMLGYPFAVVLFALAINAIYRTHNANVAEKREEPFVDRLYITRRRRNQAWLSVGILLLTMVLIWMSIWLVSSWYGRMWWFAWWETLHWRLLVSAGLALVAIIVILVCLFLLFCTIWQIFACPTRATLTRETWKAFHTRYACLAHHQADEAIRGLRQIQTGIAGPVLPRIRVPGEGEFSNNGRARRPEAELEESRVVNRFLNILLLPIRLIYQWPGRYLYNDIFATLVDEFVLGRLTDGAHGADIWGSEVGLVSATPIPRKGEYPEGRSMPGGRRVFRNRESDVRRYTAARYHNPNHDTILEKELLACLAGPPKEVRQEIENATRKPAGRFLQDFRGALGMPRSVQTRLPQLLKQALSGGEWSDLLIHTTYFRFQSVQRLIRDIILNAKNSGVVCAIDAGDPREVDPDGPAPWPPPGVFAAILRNCVRFGLLALVPLLIALMAWLILYPISHSFFVEWATKSPAPQVALKSLILPSDPTAPYCKWIPRWCAAVVSIDPEAKPEDKFQWSNMPIGSKLVFQGYYAEALASIGRHDRALSVFQEAQKNAAQPEQQGLRGFLAYRLSTAGNLTQDACEKEKYYEVGRSLGTGAETIIKTNKTEPGRSQSEDPELKQKILVLHDQLRTVRANGTLPELSDSDSAEKIKAQIDREARTSIRKVEALSQYGWLFVLRGERKEAEILFKAAEVRASTQHSSTMDQCWAVLAGTYSRLGRYEDATRLYDRCERNEARLWIVRELLVDEMERRAGIGSPKMPWFSLLDPYHDE